MTRYRQRSTFWPFIAWDGEGTTPKTNTSYGGVNQKLSYPEIGFVDYHAPAQPYVLLANSVGGQIINENGLSTLECFELILNTKKRHPHSIFVGFGFNYDVNQILKDLPVQLRQALHDQGTVYIGGALGYRIEWRPRKWFKIYHYKTKRGAAIYDVLGFFQKPFLEACKDYLGKSDPELAIIQEGKAARETFDFADLETFIIPYNWTELKMLVRMMDILRADFHSIGLYPNSRQWYGPGAIANMVFKEHEIQVSRDIPEAVSDAARHAYAGGRAEQFYVGRYTGIIYEYDIHSAYPAAALELPNLCDGAWEYASRFEQGTFGVWFIDHRGELGDWRPDRPQPLFCRSDHGLISYPAEVQGWYWTPEAACVAPDSVLGGWVFRPASNDRPFAFIEAMYEQRRLLKNQGLSSERAVKLVLNSIYGKLAEQVGGETGPPTWHQLEWAGYITSYTRAKIYQAMMSAKHPREILAVETDAVFALEPLNLPISEKLGDWELKEHLGITYIQTGFYYAGWDGERCKYRGMDRDRDTGQPVGLPFRSVVDHLSKRPKHAVACDPLSTLETRFIGLALGLQTSAEWRSWQRRRKDINIDLDPRSHKRVHITADCMYCQSLVPMSKHLHPCNIGGYSGYSHPRDLPWIAPGNDNRGTKYTQSENKIAWN